MAVKIRLRRMGAKRQPSYEKAQQWLKNGAQPTDTVRALLKKSGAIQ